jgi:hypothetical protein
MKIIGIEYRIYDSSQELLTRKMYEKICDRHRFALQYRYEFTSSSTEIQKKKPFHLVIGMSYIAYIAFDGDGKCTMKILTLPWKKGAEIDIYRPDKSMSAMQVSKNNASEETEEVKTLTYLFQRRPYKTSHWECCQKRIYHPPTNEQALLLKQCIQTYQDKKNSAHRPSTLVVFLSGESRTGKSYFAQLLCHRLKGVLCDTFYPQEYGTNFNDIYFTVFPTPDKPLVLVLNEIETIFDSFSISKESESFQRDVSDKTSWNNFLDRLSSEENVILIMTSNYSIEELSLKYDRSYLRHGRVHCYETFHELISF